MVNLNSVEGIESLIEKRTKPLKKQIKELTNLVNELKEAINYTRCCTELCDDKGHDFDKETSVCKRCNTIHF